MKRQKEKYISRTGSPVRGGREVCRGCSQGVVVGARRVGHPGDGTNSSTRRKESLPCNNKRRLLLAQHLNCLCVGGPPYWPSVGDATPALVGGLQRVVATPTVYHPLPTGPTSCPLHRRPYFVLERERTAIHAAKCTGYLDYEATPIPVPTRLDRPPRIAAGPWDDPFRVPTLRTRTNLVSARNDGGEMPRRMQA